MTVKMNELSNHTVYTHLSKRIYMIRVFLNLLDGGCFIGVRDNGKSAAFGHLLQIRRQRHNQFFLGKRGSRPRIMEYEKCGYFTHQQGAGNHCLHRSCSSSFNDVTVQVGSMPSGSVRPCAFSQTVDRPDLIPPRISDSAVSPTISTRSRSGLPACASA